jgi:hypothetical protein
MKDYFARGVWVWTYLLIFQSILFIANLVDGSTAGKVVSGALMIFCIGTLRAEVNEERNGFCECSCCPCGGKQAKNDNPNEDFKD